MSFSIRNLSVLAYAAGFTLWHYKGHGATLADIASPGFFNGARDMLATGDMMMVSAVDGGTTIYIAQGNSGYAGASVRVAPMSPFPALIAVPAQEMELAA